MSLDVGATRTCSAKSKVHSLGLGLSRALDEPCTSRGADRVLALGFWSSRAPSAPARLVDLALARGRV